MNETCKDSVQYQHCPSQDIFMLASLTEAIILKQLKMIKTASPPWLVIVRKYLGHYLWTNGRPVFSYVTEYWSLIGQYHAGPKLLTPI